jgi:hypothetical protein
MEAASTSETSGEDSHLHFDKLFRKEVQETLINNAIINC